MVRSFLRTLAPLAFVAAVPAIAGAGHYGSSSRVVVRNGGGGSGATAGLVPLNAGAGLSSFGMFPSSSGLVYTTNPSFGFGQGTTSPTSGASLASFFNGTSGLAGTGSMFTYSGLSSGTAGYYVVASPGLAEFNEFVNFRANARTAAAGGGGAALASINDSMTTAAAIAASDDYSQAAASIGESNLADIAGYLSQFAGKAEFWQKAINLFGVFARNNPWFNLDALGQGPLGGFLNQIFQSKGAPGAKGTPGGGNAALTAAVNDLTASVKRLEGRVQAIEKLTPVLIKGDHIDAVSEADNTVTVTRKGKQYTITPPAAGLAKDDDIWEVYADGSLQVRKANHDFQTIGVKGTPVPVAAPGGPAPVVAPVPKDPNTPVP